MTWAWEILTALRRSPLSTNWWKRLVIPRNHRYSLSRGIPRLRDAITARYQKQYGVTLNPETEAIVTIGAKDALAHLLFAIIGPGDVVVSP